MMCTDQSEFLYKLPSVAKDCKFSYSDDIIKLLLLINNKMQRLGLTTERGERHLNIG